MVALERRCVMMDTRSMLLSVLAARAGLPANLSAEELMPRLLAARPELAPLRQLLQRPPESGSAPDDDEGEEQDWNVAPRLATHRAAGVQGASRSDELVRALRTVIDTLASALGACPACWGTDATCAECGGQGRPGARSPDPALFHALVLPAARRWSADARMRDAARGKGDPARAAPPPRRDNDHRRANGHHPEERT
jgi:hypothetical protein